MKTRGGLRWWVVGLVALAAVINYIDRQAFGVLWVDIAEDLFPELDADARKARYAAISGVFIFAYATGQAAFGKIFDWIGTRLGFALSIGLWSAATMLHALAKGVLSFSIFRVLLGFAEAGNWPGAAKANAEWFPTKERAFAQGIFNSGAAMGGIVAFPIIGLLSGIMGWQYIFIVIGLLGFLWLIPWFYIVKSPPESHPLLSEAEKNYILSGQENQDLNDDGSYDEGYSPSTGKLLGHKESWGVIIASAAIDPIWWLFIVYIPIYLNEVFGMNVKEIAFSGWVPYVGAMLGAWYGGLLAQRKLSKGWIVDKTRKYVITLGCLIMIPCFILLRYPGSPNVLSIFGVKEATSIAMADPEVKKITNNKDFKELFKDQSFVKSIEGKTLEQIKANPKFNSTFESTKWLMPKADASAEERTLPKYGPPKESGIAALGSLEEILDARKTAALIAIMIMAILLFGFQTAIGNVQTLPSDLFSGKVVGTLAGLAGMAAKFGAFGLTILVPLLTIGGNYTPAFIVGGILALIALAAIWLLCPKIEPLKPIEQ